MAKEEKSAVERLKDRLYARGSVGKEIQEDRSPLTPNEDEVPRSWKDAEPIVAPGTLVSSVSPFTSTSESAGMPAFSPPPKPRMVFATKFFLGSMIFFLAALGVSAILFFGGVNTTSPQNIDVQVVAPSLVDGGKPTTLEIIVNNRNTTDLELADLIVDYPQGARDPVNPTRSLTHERLAVGTIKSGQQVKKTTSALFFGSEGTTQTVLAHLNYSVAGSNAVFEKQGQASFTVGSAPVSLTVDAPSRATAGDQFSMNVTVRSNATTPVDNVVVEGQYPFGFSVLSTTPSAGAGGTIWRLGTLKPGATKTIHLTGSIEAADGDERVFRFLVGSNSDQTDPHVKVPFLTVPQTLTVEKPFISGAISVEDKTGANITAAAGTMLHGKIVWENNLPDAVTGLEISLSFDGPALDKNSISGGSGFYQSSNSTILWTSSSDSSLASVAPGGRGSLSFSFKTLPPGANNVLVTNPTVTLNLTVRGTRQSEGGTSSSVASAATMKVTFASQLSATAQSFRNSGPFQNFGPMPPRAEQDTSYTITWSVGNSANTAANVVGQALLPPYIKFIKGDPDISYDEGSRIVKWTLGDVRAGVGYSFPQRQASFQVVITPSTSQIGSTPDLSGSLTVSGQDRFAQVQLEADAPAPTINVEDINGMDVIAPKQ